METKTVKLYSLDYSNARTYLMAALFIAGNMALPQLFHLIPQGGITWLPIYFFTLIGAYKFGWKVGLLTAVLSPIINSLLFGMPLPAVLPAILLKSVLLAAAAGWAAHRFNRISLPILYKQPFSKWSSPKRCAGIVGTLRCPVKQPTTQSSTSPMSR